MTPEASRLFRQHAYLDGQWLAADEAVSYTHLTLPTICSV